MPRYIDVDALKANHGMKDACSECDKEVSGFSKSCQYDTVYTLMDFCGWLDDMPTVTIDHIAEVSKKVASSRGHENGKDVIYRQDAIDIINADKTPPNTPLITPTAKRDFEIYDSACDRHIKMIGELPSAQPDACENTCEIERKSNDMISRQVAIEAIGKKSDEIYKTKQKGATYPHDDFFQGMAYAEDVVKRLPSAQPETCRGCKYEPRCSHEEPCGSCSNNYVNKYERR